MSLTVVVPTVITPDMVVANTLAEQHPTWTASSTYGDGDRVVSGRSVYESVQAGNTGNDPAADLLGAYWVRVGASNQWAIFDGEVSLPSEANGGFSVTLDAGPFGVVGLMGMSDISEVRVLILRNSDGVVLHDRAYDLLADGIDTPYEFFYTWPRPYLSERAFVDLPTAYDARVTLTFAGGADMRLGEIVLGTPNELGDTIKGVSLGLADYSLQERDRWGRLTLRRGHYARTPTIPFVFKPERLNKVHGLLRRLRGRACLYIPSTYPGLESTVLLGIYTRMRIDLQTSAIYYASLDLEGLAESD